MCYLSFSPCPAHSSSSATCFSYLLSQFSVTSIAWSPYSSSFHLSKSHLEFPKALPAAFAHVELETFETGEGDERVRRQKGARACVLPTETRKMSICSGGSVGVGSRNLKDRAARPLSRRTWSTSWSDSNSSPRHMWIGSCQLLAVKDIRSWRSMSAYCVPSTHFPNPYSNPDKGIISPSFLD